jgi:hypothetical protein
MDPEKAQSLGIKDKGKWLPFTFKMHIVEGCKVSTDDVNDPVYNCTTLYTSQGDTFIIDTPFPIFSKLFKDFNNNTVSEDATPSVEL